ncbi:MAG: methyltransferase domain-containing protein [Acidobacteriota bacterium]|jgi:phosphatidylethanolamine/phosphatidyl-N-methylethanolamine N-methyltransferase
MDRAKVQRVYSRWSKVYDGTFGMLLSGARRRAWKILALEGGESALEVGVGTGLSMPLMPPQCRFTGVDFSRPMLERAHARLHDGGLHCRAALVEADGAHLPFPDRTFDAAIAPFVVSVAPRPVTLLHEMVRVSRPGARLLVLNHFTSRNPLAARLERGLSAVTTAVLGFHADFPLEPLFERAGIEIDDVQRVTTLGSWYAVTFTRREM